MQKAVFDAQADENTLVSQFTVPVFAANVWFSGWKDAKAFRRVRGIVVSDQPLADPGVSVMQSQSTAPSDEDYEDEDYPTTGAATLKTDGVTGQTIGYVFAFSIEVAGEFVGIAIKHNGVAPTKFRVKLVGVGIT